MIENIKFPRHPRSHLCLSEKGEEGNTTYEVDTIGRLLKITGLFCRISSLLQGSFAKETYHFKEPTSRSHYIAPCVSLTWAHAQHGRNPLVMF